MAVKKTASKGAKKSAKDEPAKAAEKSSHKGEKGNKAALKDADKEPLQKAKAGAKNAKSSGKEAPKESSRDGAKSDKKRDEKQELKKTMTAKAQKAGIEEQKSSGSKRINSPLLRRPFDEIGDAVCRGVACEGLGTTGGYCRLHYIKNWKKIKRKEVILREGRLNQYIEELVAKYPDRHLEAIRQDLASDKDFAKVIYDLDLDEGVEDFDVESSESVDSLIDTIKRDFDDEPEGF